MMGSTQGPGRFTYAVFWIILVVSGALNSLSAQPAAFLQPEAMTSQNGLPQGFVPSILQDRQGFIWMATRGGLCRYDGRQTKVFQVNLNGRPGLSSNTLSRLRLDPKGNIWILSENSTLDCFDPVTERFVRFDTHPAITKHRQNFSLTDFQFDHSGQLWLVFHNHGLLGLNLTTNRTEWVPFQARFLKTSRYPLGVVLQLDDRGQLCLLAQDSLVAYDVSRKALVPYQKVVKESATTSFYPQFGQVNHRLNQLRILGTGPDPVRTFPMARLIPENRVVPVVFDSQGNLYTQNNGVLVRGSGSGVEVIYDYSRERWHPMWLYIDRSDVLWVGTDGFGIRKFNLRKPPFQAIPYQQGFLTDWLTRWGKIPPDRQPIRPPSASQYYFRNTLDRTGRMLWYTHGFPAAIHRLNTVKNEVTTFPLPGVVKRRSNIYPVTRDTDGTLWVVVEHQLIRFNEASETWQISDYSLDLDLMGSVLQMVADQQSFWFCTADNGLFRLDRKTRQLSNYRHQADDPTSLGSNILYCLFSDPADQHRLWIGTYGAGLCAFDKRTGRSQRITTGNGLPNNVVYSAIPDQHGNLWIGTDKGLCQMNRRTFQIRTYTTDDGILAEEFNRFHYIQFADGAIVMAGVEGFTAFQPSHLQEDQFHPQVELTGLQIKNRPVMPGPNSPLGALPIQAVQEITLPYDQNFITAQFVGLQFNQNNLNRYRYRLRGIDETWIETSRPEAVYTDLRPGTYTLIVNASNTSGNWSRHTRRLSIQILPPFWATWWAYFLYALAFIGAAVGVFRLYANRLKLRQSMELKQKEAEQLRILDEMKNRFFSNITHEFRTPLTLILTPTQQLKPRLEQPDDQRRLAAIDRNAQQLLDLVNQLMDISKLEAGALPIEEVRGDIAGFIQSIGQSFQPAVQQKGVELRLEGLERAAEYNFDAEKLERILTNLLSNALKFTPEGGQIMVQFQIVDGLAAPGPHSPETDLPTTLAPWMLLIVSDTGIGISAEHLPRIFDRFYQADSSGASANKQVPGTGIGLALVKELVDLLQGQIEVKSEADPSTGRRGTSFRLSIPLRPVIAGSTSRSAPVSPLPTRYEAEETSDGAPRVLLVEDNAELAQFVAESLPLNYQIIQAENGRRGFEQAVEQLPDLIISDVLMPEMDGFALCDQLKKDLRTSHIPVMLLTAKSSLNDRLDGLTLGADDYMTKPFNIRELQVRVQNLLEGRRRLREWVRTMFQSPDVPLREAPPAPLDLFLEKLYALIDQNLDDSTFGVEELAGQLDISRIQLYRKIKSLAGLTATELLRNYRLKKAAELLRAGHPVGEAGNLVGFDTPAYFTKCFREHFNMTPTEFVIQHLNNRGT
ncbi:hypothetical protein GCM10027299_26680 [Larkinella ripae]